MSAGGLVHAAQQVQYRGFACAAGAQHHAELALFNAEGHMIGRMNHRIPGGIILTYLIKSDIAHH